MPEIKPAEISAILRQEMSGFRADTNLEETGTILQIGDGIARIYGLSNAQAGELVTLNDDGLNGVVLNLEEDNVGIVLLGDPGNVKEGDIVKRTGHMVSIQAGEGLIGRVINTLGQPIDGAGPIQGTLYEMPLERKAPGLFSGSL
jgi:F-type H+/Na+-transporting ATPase subunit alpha